MRRPSIIYLLSLSSCPGLRFQLSETTREGQSEASRENVHTTCRTIKSELFECTNLGAWLVARVLTTDASTYKFRWCLQNCDCVLRFAYYFNEMRYIESIFPNLPTFALLMMFQMWLRFYPNFLIILSWELLWMKMACVSLSPHPQRTYPFLSLKFIVSKVGRFALRK